ncbi:MAG: class I SAM-dependent methyltransferase [Mariniblastus sp.]|nr:class I SAM-dependent methyltransferase [Mariniblastus sp.]
MSTSQQKTLEDFIQLQNRNALSHAIRAAIDLGVVGALRQGQRTAEQLASELNVYPDALRRLLDVVAGTELIEKYGDDYALSAITRLIPDVFIDFGDKHWKELALHVKTGAPLPICEEVELNDQDYLFNKASEEWMLTPAALAAAQVLDMGKTRRAVRILEIGCGSAVFGATLAHSDPNAVISLIDNEFNIKRARKTVASIGLEHKVTFIETETLDDLDAVPELAGQTFDLVLMAGLLHQKTSGECQRMFQQLHTLIKPTRELAIIDVFPGQKEGDLQRAIFDLELNLRTSRGRLHDPRLLEEGLKEAGFGQIQFAHLPTTPNYWGLVLAQRN